jgi:hypothetical protein
MQSRHRLSLHRHVLRSLLPSGAVVLAPALAAEVTPQRLADPEPQNWLMNHRTYDGRHCVRSLRRWPAYARQLAEVKEQQRHGVLCVWAMIRKRDA